MHTIRGRLLLGVFLIITITTTTLFLLNNYYFKKRANIADLAYSIEEVKGDLYRLIYLSEAYLEGSSDKDEINEYLPVFLLQSIQVKLDIITQSAAKTQIDVMATIDPLGEKLKDFQFIIQELDSLQNLISVTPSHIEAKANLLNTTFSDMNAYVNALSAKVAFEKKSNFRRLRLFYLLVSLLTISLSLLAGFLFSNALARPLKSFSNYLSHFVENNFRVKIPLKFKYVSSEVRNISEQFNAMAEALNTYDKQRNEAITCLKVERTHYKQLSELLPLSIFEMDAKGRIIYINKTFKQKFRYTDNLPEFSVSDLIADPCCYQKVFQAPHLETYELNLLRSDNTEVPCLIFTDTITTGSNFGGKRGVIVDISERKKYIEALEREKQRAETSDRLKSAFLANVSHELRTPLNGILGFSELLTMEFCENKQYESYVEHIRANSDILMQLIDDLIDFAKMKSGILELDADNFDLYQMLSECFNGFSPQLQQTKPDIEYRLNTNIQAETFVRSDSRRLKQIITNLIGNAIKFTHKGSITVDAHIVNKHLSLKVQDTGIGIHKDKLGLIFERFRQADESVNRRFGGTGLGLSIVNQLVELLKGTITVESEPEVGSSFIIRIPLGVNASVPDKLQDVSRSFRFDNRHILIAEDDDASYKLLETLLIDAGATVYRAINGNEAIQKFLGVPGIDLILMDLNMPVLSGYTATEVIRAHNSTIPIIAQTACALDIEKKEAIEVGCSDVIIKPISKNTLLDKVSYYFLQNSPLECFDLVN